MDLSVACYNSKPQFKSMLAGMHGLVSVVTAHDWREPVPQLSQLALACRNGKPRAIRDRLAPEEYQRLVEAARPAGCVAMRGGRVRVDDGVPIAHGSHMDALARACEDYFYNFDPGADVPLAAAEALSAGLMSPALIDLACLRRDDRSGICTLVPQVYAELGRVFPAMPAAFARAKEVARECLGGRLISR